MITRTAWLGDNNVYHCNWIYAATSPFVLKGHVSCNGYLHEQHGASMCFKAAFWLLFAFEATWADVRPSMHTCASALKRTVMNAASIVSFTKHFSLTKVFWHAQSPKLHVTVQSLFHSASVYCRIQLLYGAWQTVEIDIQHMTTCFYLIKSWNFLL
jgi:hypothetical protein